MILLFTLWINYLIHHDNHYYLKMSADIDSTVGMYDEDNREL